MATKKTARVRLPRDSGQTKDKHEFVSVNFKNYRIKRGEYVEVPQEVAEVLENAEIARDAAIEYAENVQIRESKEQ